MYAANEIIRVVLTTKNVEYKFQSLTGALSWAREFFVTGWEIRRYEDGVTIAQSR